jgi:DNA modification methylase
MEKVTQPYKNPSDARVAELIKNGSKGRPLYDWFADIQIVKNVSDEKTSHPCPMPLVLMRRIILLVSQENDLILDPFCGSGTTCVAAKMLGRRYIGIDISEKYCQIARQRLEAVDTGVPVKEQNKGQRALFPV